MGCLDWTEKVTVQKTISSEGLFCPESFVKLPGLKPGEEGMIRFNFTAPSKTGLHESIWHFFDGKDRFGPAIKFKFLVKSESQAIPLKGVEMKDFGKNPEVEMKGIGISAKSQEMVEMSSKRLTDKILSSKSNKEIITITDSNHNSFEEAKDSLEDDFDLLASEVNTLTIETITRLDRDEMNQYSYLSFLFVVMMTKRMMMTLKLFLCLHVSTLMYPLKLLKMINLVPPAQMVGSGTFVNVFIYYIIFHVIHVIIFRERVKHLNQNI